MQTVKQSAKWKLFEVVLYFEDNLGLFSTVAHASMMQEAIEQAEREFSAHTFHHRLGRTKAKATSACVIDASDDHSFAKRDGKWQPLQ
jgi:hypothetical protein